MQAVLVKIPAWFKQTPEAPIVRMINHSPGRAPGLFCWRWFGSVCFCVKPVQSLHKLQGKLLTNRDANWKQRR